LRKVRRLIRSIAQLKSVGSSESRIESDSSCWEGAVDSDLSKVSQVNKDNVLILLSKTDNGKAERPPRWTSVPMTVGGYLRMLNGGSCGLYSTFSVAKVACV
jgi:hypothetical protein